MPINFTQRLSFTLTRTSIFVVLAVGTLIASFQVYIDYTDRKEFVDYRIQSLIDATSTPVAKAIYSLDTDLAQEVVNGLKKYDFLHHISIFDDAGVVMAIHDQPIPSSETMWLTRILTGHSTTYAQSIGDMSKNYNGQLILKLNNDVILAPIYKRSLHVFLSGLAGALIIAFILAYFYHRYLTQPLFEIAHNFARLNKTKLSSARLKPIEEHEDNELGHIVDSANELLIILDKREQALEQNEQQLRIILNASPNQVFALNHDNQFVFLNTATARFYKQTARNLEGKNFIELHKTIDEKEAFRFFQHLEKAEIKPTETHTAKLNLKDADGEDHILHISVTPYTIDQKQCLLVIANDVTARIEAENRVERLAYFDTLTKLPNRHQIQERLQEDIYTSEKMGAYGALLFIDVDDFKRINDSFGHSTGDALLLKLSNRMQTQIRKSETLARLGGDEFILSVPSIATTPERTQTLASNLAERLLQNIRKPLRIGEHELEVSASIGIVLYRQADEDLDKLLSAADTAMYQAKAQGRDRYLIFNTTMSDEASRLVTLESDIRKGIGEHQFNFHLQPLLDSETRTMIGAEALLRWQHPDKGQVLPDQFIEFLENSPMMGKVGEQILDKVCSFIYSCRNRGIMEPRTRIAVNISAREFHQPDFYNIVTDTLEKYHLDGSCLELEITEGAALKNVDLSIEKMHQLRDLGIKFALDDFGTGYSSLSYLKQLPIDKIKIDKSFIKDITYDKQDAMLVTAIIAIAETLELEVVAEGVETEDQAAWLNHHGNIQFQGFLFDRPMPQVEFENIYLQENPTLSLPIQ
ncbi:MAG: EAL domain-containing protein [Agarilytica sp.]